MKYLSILLSAWLLCTTGTQVHAERPSPSSEFLTPLHVPSVICGECHEEIYKQWQRSMHSQSAPGNDPVHTAIYKELVGSPEQEGLTFEGKYPACLQCHAPNAAKDGSTNLKLQNYAEGVNCVTCHVLTSYKGMQNEQGEQQYGLPAYEYSNTHLQGPSGRYLSPRKDAQHTFPINPNQTMLRTSEVCLGCHASYHNAQDLAVYETGKEYIENGNKNITCQSCHMPKLNGEANHAILSAHSDEMLARPVVMKLTPTSQDDQISLSLRLENTLPHGFPSGAPFRNAYIKVSAYNRKDELVWGNYEGYPPDFSKDPQARLEYVVAGADSKPGLAYTAQKLLSDTRLKPFEVRQLQYQLPAKDVYIIRAELVFNILSEAIIEKYGETLEGNLTNPVVASIAEIKIR